MYRFRSCSFVHADPQLLSPSIRCTHSLCYRRRRIKATTTATGRGFPPESLLHTEERDARGEKASGGKREKRETEREGRIGSGEKKSERDELEGKGGEERKARGRSKTTNGAREKQPRTRNEGRRFAGERGNESPHPLSLRVHPYLPYLPTAMPSRPDTATATVPLLPPPSPSLCLSISLSLSSCVWLNIALLF